MDAYQQRVVQEQADLDAKIIALNDFIGTEAYFGLPEADFVKKAIAERDAGRTRQARLRTQVELMASYSAILGTRIKHFA